MSLRRLRLVLGFAAVGLVAAACGGDDDDTSSGPTTTAAGTTASAAATTTTAAGGPATPAAGDVCTVVVEGGTLTFGTLTPTLGLDPTIALGSGSSGGIELAALYDNLLRYDPDKGTYEPHVAESFSRSADETEWTVKLRPNIKFGNGDPLTADAVKFSFERMAKARVSSAALAATVQSMTIPDPLTIVFKLTSPFGQFPYVLAEDTGAIVNPNVVRSLGDQAFNLSPKGAGVGPFEFERFAPNEEVVMKAKSDYWGGPVCIDTLRFVSVSGGRATYQAFTKGETQMAFLVDPVVEADADADHVKLFEQVSSADRWLVMNNGVRGTSSPLKDVRIRKAVAAAIDLDTLNQRVYDGKSRASSALIWKDVPIYPGIDGPKYDPNLAKQLVAEAKASGWDGKLRLTASNVPTDMEATVTLKAMLEAAGMQIAAENLPVNDASRKVLTEPDFDLGFSGLSVFEDSPYARLDQFATGNVRSRTGYSAPDMDAALEQLKRAETRDQKKAALAKVQQAWNNGTPSAILLSGAWTVLVQPQVHGVEFSRDVVPLFHHAYIAN